MRLISLLPPFALARTLLVLVDLVGDVAAERSGSGTRRRTLLGLTHRRTDGGASACSEAAADGGIAER